MTESVTFRIEVFQDTVCPWCRIGKRHLELALAEWDGPRSIDVSYRAFYLDPTIPPDGRDFRRHMQAKGGGRVPLETFFERPREMGEAVDLTFNFEDIDRAPNTTLSHQLLKFGDPELEGDLLDALYAAYFEYGRDIGELEVLLDLAEQHGMERQRTRERLEAGEGRQAIEADRQRAAELGVTGVPFYVFDDRYGLSGAQPPQAFQQVLAQLSQDLGEPSQGGTQQ